MKITETARWKLDEDEDGNKFWRGGGEDDENETCVDAGEPLIAHPDTFPVGTIVICQEPYVW